MRPRLRCRRTVALAGAVTIVAATLSAIGITPAAAATEVYTRPSDGVLHLAGHGFGHGHGMSQWGAYGGAERGVTWQNILAWYYAAPKLATMTPTITVRISADGIGSDGRYDVQVKPASGLAARDSKGHTFSAPAKDAKGNTFDLWRAVVLADGTERVSGHTSAGWTNVAPSGGTLTSWSGWIRFSDTAQVLTLVRPGGTTVAYRGFLELVPSGSTGTTVNIVGLDNYVRGVVPSEMPCSWTPTVGGTKRLDGLEAQAVAARSYAAWRWANPRSSTAALVDNTGDQAYGGYTAERTALTSCPWTLGDGTKTSASAAAVVATATKVMVDSAGHALFAQYSASNGGFEIAGGQSYLPSRPDVWDGTPTESWSSHSWTDSITTSQIQQAWPSIGTFTSLSVTGREQLTGKDQTGATVGEQWGGRVTSLTVTGTKGSVSVSGATFRSAMSLMSEWFTVVVHKPSAPRSVAARPGDARATVSWVAPASDGGSAVNSYTVTASPAITPVTVSSTARSAVITGLTNDKAYVFSVTAHNRAGSSVAGVAASVTPAAPTVFHPLPHAIVVDTGAAGLGAGAVRTVQVSGVAGVPSSGAKAVALEVISLSATASSSATVWPHGGVRPPTPALAFGPNQRTSSTIWVDLSSAGQVDLANAAGTARLRLVVAGYTKLAAGDTGGSVLTAVPTRRIYGGSAGVSVPAGAVRTLVVAGANGVPSGATAAVLQLTLVKPTARNGLMVRPAGSRSGAWDLYAEPSTSRTMTAVVALGSGGAVTLTPLVTGTVTADLVGWLAPAPASPTVGTSALLNPARRLASTSLAAGATTTLTLPSASGVSPSAKSVFLLVAATGPTSGGLVVWPGGTTSTKLANLWFQGSVASTSAVLVPLGSGAHVSLTNTGTTAAAVRVDVVGWSTG